jgi:hypothetical protein
VILKLTFDGFLAREANFLRFGMIFESLASDSLIKAKIMPKVNPIAKRQGARAIAQGILTGRAKIMPRETMARARVKDFFIMQFSLCEESLDCDKSLI